MFGERNSLLALVIAAVALSACGDPSKAEGAGDSAVVAQVAQALSEPPVVSVPTTQQSTNEDSPLTFLAAAGNALTVSDGDSPVINVQIDVTNGTFKPKTGKDVTITGGGTSTVILTGSPGEVTIALERSVFQPAPNFFGEATLQMKASDNENNPLPKSITIVVNAFNDPPINSVPSGTQVATEDVPRSFNLAVTDIDVLDVDMEIWLTSSNGTVINLPPDVLAQGNVTLINGTSSGQSHIEFTGKLPDINAILNGITVTPPLNYIGTSTLELKSDDNEGTGPGLVTSDTDTISINWSAVNDAPVNVTSVVSDTPEETPISFTLGVNDVDVTTNILQVTLDAFGGVVSLASTANLAFSAGDGSADSTVVFSGTQSNVNAALTSVNFAPNGNFAGTATVRMTTSDLGNSGAGGAKTDVDTIPINVIAHNDAPVISAPLPQATNEDVARPFSVSNGNAITISDVDASTLQVTLSVGTGALTLASKTGISFQSGDGTADATMTFTGTINSVNSVLNGLVFTPPTNYFGTVILTVLADDAGATGVGGPANDTEEISITVRSVNDAPDATNDAFVIVEDSAATGFDVLANDTDLDADTLTVVTASAPANGSATVVGTTINYTPKANFNGTDSFSYTVADGNGGEDTATVTITVTSENDPPTASDDVFNVKQNSGANRLNVLSNDSAAPDLGETLSVALLAAPANGTVTVVGTTEFDYTPSSGFSGDDTFTYAVSDGSLQSAATVTIHVVTVNETPVNALPPPQSLTEDTRLTFSSANGNAITVADENSPELTIELSVSNGKFRLGSTTGLSSFSAPEGASLIIVGPIAALNAALNNGQYQPNLDYAGPASLTLITSDSTAKSAENTLNLTVRSTNDAPANTVPTTLTQAKEDEPKPFTTILVSDVDVGAGQLEVSLSANNGTVVSISTTAGLSFSAGDGQADTAMTFRGTLVDINAALNGLTVTPPANYIGPSTLTIVTNDLGNTGGAPAQDSDVVSLNWTAVNDPPVNRLAGPQVVLEEETVTFSSAGGTALTVTDADIGAANMKVTLTATNGRVTLGNPSLVSITAGTGSSDPSVTFSGTLDNVNNALEGTTFVPNLDFVGAAGLTMTSDDGGGATGKVTNSVAITVDGKNDAPVNTIPNNQAIAEDGTLLFSTTTGNRVSVADVDASSLQVSLSAIDGTLVLGTKTSLTFQADTPESVTFTGTISAVNTALNTLKFTPTPDFAGMASVTIATSDLGAFGTGGTRDDRDTIQINVAPSNDKPVANADALTLLEDAQTASVAVLANDRDVDGDVLTVTAVTTPEHGTATTDGTQVNYQPAADYFGADSFTYTISDGKTGGVSTATVTVDVTPVNDPPNAADDTFTVEENAVATAVPVLANDTFAPDTGEALTITTFTVPANGAVVLAGGGTGLTYKPNAGYSGGDSFTYTISDGNGLTDTATVSVTVTPFDFKPVAVADSLTVAEDSTGNALAVLDNDTNLGNAPLTVEILVAAEHGTATVQPDNTVAYTPAPDYFGPDSFEYRVTDSNGDAASAKVSLTVTGVSDTPIAVADSATTTEELAVKVTVQANDTALVDQPITVAVSIQPGNGTATVEVDGTITYKPMANFNGTDTFNYTVTDSDGESSPATVTVTVTPVNDPPAAIADAASTRTGEAIVVDVLANDTDVDDDPLTVTAVGTPTQGTATVTAEGKVSYTPPAGFRGTAQFTYTVGDGTGLTSTANVIVGVGIDSDGDGLIDIDEIELGTDPQKLDTDGDQLSDSVELNSTGTDPLDGDSDDDGLFDGSEDLNRNGALDAGETDPHQADSDGDGLSDGLEVGLAAAEGEDSGGFVGDADPATTTDPRKADTDNGGLSDGEEDANRNGRVDSGETNPTVANDDFANAPDYDGDGIPDERDNCPRSANGTQDDSDGNGVGDICEPKPEEPAGGCGATGTGASGWAALLSLAFVAWVTGRRRESVR